MTFPTSRRTARSPRSNEKRLEIILSAARLFGEYGFQSIALEAIGPQQSVLTTDIFSRWVPPEPECLRMFAEQLSYLGISAPDIAHMLVTNPRRFLGLTVSAP